MPQEIETNLLIEFSAISYILFDGVIIWRNQLPTETYSDDVIINNCQLKLIRIEHDLKPLQD